MRLYERLGHLAPTWGRSLSTRKASGSNTPRLTLYPTLPDVPQLYCWAGHKRLTISPKRRPLDYLGGDAAGPFEQVEDLVIGYYEGDKLIYAARTRSRFTPASRAELFNRIKPLEIEDCPFANLPEKKAGRWGEGLTAAKMKDCRWLRPVLVGQFEFVEWTPDNHLRHSRFVGLRDEKKRPYASWLLFRSPGKGPGGFAVRLASARSSLKVTISVGMLSLIG